MSTDPASSDSPVSIDSADIDCVLTGDGAQSWLIERRDDGAVLVRVPSRATPALPDAVFAFRAGDPQFCFWEEQLRQRQSNPGELTSRE